jgi:hypothetical protein
MSEIRGKKPKVLGARVAGLRLTPEERFVMARIDGNLSVDDLIGVTGIEPDRLERIVEKLAFDGAVDLAEEPRVVASAAQLGVAEGETTSLADFAAALGMDPNSFGAPAPAPAPAPTPQRPLLRRYTPAKVPPAARVEKLPQPVAAPERQPEVGDPLATPEALPPASDPVGEEEGQGDEPQPVLVLDDPGELPEMESALDAAALEAFGEEPEEVTDPTATQSRQEAKEEDEVARAVAERNYRQVFEVRWHPLRAEERAGAARSAHGADLLALCFDPDPHVISAVLENATTGLDHVRLIAFYHRTNTGLEILSRRQDWLRDLLVERRLLRNPMVGEITLGRIINPKRLFPTYKIAIDREIPELTRTKCRGYVRKKWQVATSEERADLLIRTEARCLVLMIGCTFDAKTTAILCGRPINSVMFVQSVAKFPSSPPGLLAHLIKQPFVRKSAPLKKLLLAHPNMPGDVKRSL